MTNSLTIQTDLRHLLPPARDQGPRPLCLAFAASDFNSVNNGLAEELSVEYLAHHAYEEEGHQNFKRGLTTQSVINVLYKQGQPSEKVFPYDRTASSPRVPLMEIVPRHFTTSTTPKTSITSIEKKLNTGKAVVACISLPKTFQTITAPYILDKEIGEIGRHAVLVVGKALTQCGAKLFLIRNSWGTSWGDNGHCWLSEVFLKNRTLALLEVA